MKKICALTYCLIEICYIITLHNLGEIIMKIAYVFKSNMASTFQLGTMILPQLEDNSHMVDVIGMFFFDDNIMCLQ